MPERDDQVLPVFPLPRLVTGLQHALEVARRPPRFDFVGDLVISPYASRQIPGVIPLQRLDVGDALRVPDSRSS